MLCSNQNCGKEIENDSQFCIYSGNKLTLPELREEPREGEESTFHTIKPANQNLENPKGERGEGFMLIFIGIVFVIFFFLNCVVFSYGINKWGYGWVGPYGE